MNISNIFIFDQFQLNLFQEWKPNEDILRKCALFSEEIH